MTPHELNPEVRELLRAVFDAYSDVDPTDPDYESRLYDFTFHMTDCLPDVVEMGWAMFRPGAPPSTQATKAVYGFLIHAVPHLMAASEALHGEPAKHPFSPTPGTVLTNGTHRTRAARRPKVKR